MSFQTFKIKTTGFLKAHGTSIACYGGAIAVGVGTVLACKAAVKTSKQFEQDEIEAEEIKKKYKLDIKPTKKLKGGKKNGNSRNDSSDDRELMDLHKEGRAVLRRNNLRRAGRYCRNFALAGALILGGEAAQIAAHKTDVTKLSNMTGVAAGFAATLKKYRDEMRKERGEEAEKEFYYGVKTKEKEVVDENGKTKKVQEKVIPKDIDRSEFAKFFGVDYSTAATGYTEADLVFLKQVELAATRKLREDKWLTLNELYKMLCLVDSAGQRYGVKGGNNIGWVYDKNDPDGNKVDLGIYDGSKPNNRDYVNGYNDVILVEPNVNCLDLGNAMWGLDMKTPDPDLFRG